VRDDGGSKPYPTMTFLNQEVGIGAPELTNYPLRRLGGGGWKELDESLTEQSTYVISLPSGLCSASQRSRRLQRRRKMFILQEVPGSWDLCGHVPTILQETTSHPFVRHTCDIPRSATINVKFISTSTDQCSAHLGEFVGSLMHDVYPSPAC